MKGTNTYSLVTVAIKSKTVLDPFTKSSKSSSIELVVSKMKTKLWFWQSIDFNVKWKTKNINNENVFMSKKDSQDLTANLILSEQTNFYGLYLKANKKLLIITGLLKVFVSMLSSISGSQHFLQDYSLKLKWKHSIWYWRYEKWFIYYIEINWKTRSKNIKHLFLLNKNYKYLQNNLVINLINKFVYFIRYFIIL